MRRLPRPPVPRARTRAPSPPRCCCLTVHRLRRQVHPARTRDSREVPRHIRACLRTARGGLTLRDAAAGADSPVASPRTDRSACQTAERPCRRAPLGSQAQGFDMPTATVWAADQLCDFCAMAEFGLGFVPHDALLVPPQHNYFDANAFAQLQEVRARTRPAARRTAPPPIADRGPGRPLDRPLLHPPPPRPCARTHRPSPRRAALG